jgi:hypothetical protein
LDFAQQLNEKGFTEVLQSNAEINAARTTALAVVKQLMEINKVGVYFISTDDVRMNLMTKQNRKELYWYYL